MKKVIRIGKKNIPVWLLVTALCIAGAGAAVGTVLAGQVTGEIPVTVSQALLVGDPMFPASDAEWDSGPDATTVQGVDRQTLSGHHDKPDRSLGNASDDHTAFIAAAEVDTGDKYLIQVPLKNASGQSMKVLMTLDYPDGITVECFASDEESQITGLHNDNTRNIVRTGLYTWVFELDYEAEYVTAEWQDCIGINVATSDVIAPGFYSINGTLEQIDY